jgi:hypothetical protein
MSKRFLIDFYRLEVPEGLSPFEEILEWVMALPTEQRTHKFASAPIRLQSASSRQDADQKGFWHGELVKIRMIEPPIKASLAGNLEDIPLKDDEGIGERTAFLYHPSTRVLLLHKTLAGVSITSFLLYFQKIKGMQAEMSADPVLNLDAMRRLENFGVIQKIDLRVAGLENLSVFEQDDKAIGDVVNNLSKKFQAPFISITASMGGKKGGLNMDAVLEYVKKFQRFSSSQKNSADDKSTPTTRVMRITGKDSEDSKNSAVVDLLQDCMREKIKVADNTKRKNLTYAERKECLEEAWGKRKNEIAKMFKKP